MWQKHLVVLLTAYFSHVLWSAEVPRQVLKQGKKKSAFHEEAVFFLPMTICKTTFAFEIKG